MTEHCFISYSTVDALDFARKLANKLEGGTPDIPVWFDKDDLKPSREWDIQIDEALKTCRMVLFVMTADSTHEKSVCRQEWSRALSFKKPIVPLWVQNEIDVPFRLADRQRIDFRSSFDVGLAQLRDYLIWLDSPEGVLQTYKDRLLDAERDLQRARDEDKPRIQAEIEELTKQIEIQQRIVDNPRAAQEQTQKSIEAGLEREREPERPIAVKKETKFINPPPGIAPTYFQDRYFETEQIADFLKNDAQRLMTIIGRAGIGKTATICRLLKDLERGILPDSLGKLKVDGIVYLSEAGSHKINFANIFYDLCKLLPAEAAQKLESLYKNPHASTESKTHALLDHFHGERVVLLLDNFEPLVNEERENLPVRDAELDEALRAFLNGAHSAVNIIITTRVPPHALNLIQPGRQRVYHLEAGLEPEYAIEMLRQMDKDGILGLKNAQEDLLRRAYERTRGFPKALEALFQILSSDRYTTLEELLAMPMPENVVEALVGEAFNRLDTNAQKVMQALAIYNRPVTPAAVDYLLAPHLPAMDSAPILQRLANMHFARKESGRFYLHPVDRDFAFSLIPNDERGKTKEEDDSFTDYESRFTQHDLLTLAADYFAAARKPRAEWKKLEDLSAQLAEFDLRCTAGDYDTACRILDDIDFEYLLLWGHYHLLVDLHLRVKDKLQDEKLVMDNMYSLGNANHATGNIKGAIRYYEVGLQTAREEADRGWEATFLGCFGSIYSDLGNILKGIDFHEQALTLDIENTDHRREGADLSNIANSHSDLGEYDKSIVYYQQALQNARDIGYKYGESKRLNGLAEVLIEKGNLESAIKHSQEAIRIGEEINNPQVCGESCSTLAQAYLVQNDLGNARVMIEAALQYDEPQNNHNASALHGIIALRQAEVNTARQAFRRAIAQADEILAKTPEYYNALDAKGLALCGLAICEDKKYISDAIETFRDARKIAPHAGIVKRVLRLFDELVKCDQEGVLAEVRRAAERSAQG